MSFTQAATALMSGSPQTASGYAGSTLSPRDRQRLLGRAGSRVTVTPAFVLSAALLSIASVLAGVATLPTLEQRFSRPTFYYQVNPVPLASPGPFAPGAAVPLALTRCIDDPSIDQFGGRGGYDVSRALVAADDASSAALASAEPTAEPGPPARLVLPATFADAPNGCSLVISTRNTLPPTAPEGNFYLEGVARYVGPTGRMGSTFWRTDTFVIRRTTPP